MSSPFLRDGKIIDGKLVAEAIREEISIEVKKLKEQFGKVPGMYKY